MVSAVAAGWVLGPLAVGVVFIQLVRAHRRETGENRRLRDRLTQFEHRLGLALETTDEGGWDWDAGRRRIHLSARAMDVLGRPRTSASAIRLSEWRRDIHPEDRRSVHLALLRHLRFDLPLDTTYRMRQADGAERWIRVRGRACRDGAGQRLKLSGLMGDVTAARRAEAAKAALAARHASVLAALPDLMFELDTSLRIVRYHAADEGDLVMAPEAFMGKRSGEVLPATVARRMEAACRALCDGSRVERIEFSVPGRSGERVDYEGRFVTIDTGGYLCIVRNISAQKAAASELRRHRDNLAELVAEQTVDLLLAKEAAERLRRGQAEFLARLSHDLRSPLHAVMGFAEIGLHQSGEALRQAQCLEKIGDCARRMLTLVAEVRDVSRAELAGGQLQVMPVDWEIVCQDVLAHCKPMFAAKQLRPRLAVAESVCPVRADGLRLYQIVENLVTNAVKFSPLGGEVRLSLACHCDGPSGEEVVLTVSDQGVGLGDASPSELFARRPGALENTAEGAEAGGLGLSICRHYVEAFSGRIEAENAGGGGAVFRVCLPCARVKETSLEEDHRARI